MHIYYSKLSSSLSTTHFKRLGKSSMIAQAIDCSMLFQLLTNLALTMQYFCVVYCRHFFEARQNKKLIRFKSEEQEDHFSLTRMTFKGR